MFLILICSGLEIEKNSVECGEAGEGEWGPGTRKRKTSASQRDGRAVTF